MYFPRTACPSASVGGNLFIRNWTPACAGVTDVFPAHSLPQRKRERESIPAMTKQPVVYILASKRNGTLYIGVTSDLVKRVWQHKNDVVEGFTQKYGVHTLVYYELHAGMAEAIHREKQLKKWNRAWKIELIETNNPQWQDLWPTIIA